MDMDCSMLATDPAECSGEFLAAAECLWCAKGSTDNGAPGVPGTAAEYLAALGCTREFHADVFPVCGKHEEHICTVWEKLICARCFEGHGDIWFMNEYIARPLRAMPVS